MEVINLDIVKIIIFFIVGASVWESLTHPKTKRIFSPYFVF